MDIDQVLDALRATCAPKGIAVRTGLVKEVFVTVPHACLHEAVRTLVERFEVTHLSTITGQDLGGEIELLYHFWDRQGLTLRTSIPREAAHVPTLTDLIPGAAFYEREIREMLHVTIEGHPNPAPLLLSDDWNGEAPLRQGFTLPPNGGGDRE